MTTNSRSRLYIFFLLFTLGLTAFAQHPPAEAKPACRVKKVEVKPITETKDNLVKGTCNAEQYYAACDLAVSKLDTKCQNACKNFKKRGQEDAPHGVGACKANPVDATIPEFEDDFCKADTQHPERFMVSCTVSAECTCDP